MLKKSIALLLTIFIIIALSLIINNILKEDEKILSYTSFDKDLAQINLLIKDINSEVLNYLKANGSDIEEDLPVNFPLKINEMKIDFSLTKTNFNKNYNLVIDNKFLKNLNSNELILNNIEFLYDFKEIFKDKNITNFYQIDYLIDKYVSNTNDKKILKIKDLFIYPKIKNSIYKLGYEININKNIAKVIIFISKNYKIDDIYINLI